MSWPWTIVTICLPPPPTKIFFTPKFCIGETPEEINITNQEGSINCIDLHINQQLVTFGVKYKSSQDIHETNTYYPIIWLKLQIVIQISLLLFRGLEVLSQDDPNSQGLGIQIWNVAFEIIMNFYGFLYYADQRKFYYIYKKHKKNRDVNS